MAPDDAEAEAFVTQTLGSTLQEFPHEVQKQLVAKFCGEYAQPMTQELELVLGKRLTDDEVRHLLFRPSASQYRYYAKLLALTNINARDQSRSLPPWARTLQRRFLTQFYLQHARNWPLVEDFCNHDGLNVLVQLFVHEDLQVRGQAIDSFVQLTSHPSFDWFLKPVGYQAKVLHQKLLALASPPSQFLRHMLWNIQLCSTQVKATDATSGADSPTSASLPGGTHVLLQILAFYLSWVRKLYTKNNELRLSRKLLTLLSEWPEHTRSEDLSELALAKQVYEDFSRWPAIEDDEQEQEGCEKDSIIAQQLSPEPQSDENQDTAKAALFSREHVLDLLGSDDCDQHDQAVELCSTAIDAEMCLVDAHLLRAQAMRKNLKHRESATTRADLQRCLNDCDAVLQLDPSNIQAWKCQLEAFAAMEMWTQGREVLDTSVFHEAETMQNRFLDCDIEYFQAQRTEFAKQAQLQAEREAQHSLELAEKERKIQEIYGALLQRGKATTSKTDTTGDASQPQFEHVRKMEENVLAEAEKHPETAAEKLLKRIAKAPPKKSSTGKQQDGSTKSIVRGRAFARKFHTCKASPAALGELLMATELDDLRVALESSLSEESFLVILQALEYRNDHTSSEERSHLASIWQTMVSLTRFQLYLDVAPAKTRDALGSCLQYLSSGQWGMSGASPMGA